VDHAKLTVDLDQTEYVRELLERFNMTNCLPVSAPMVQRLSMQKSGGKFFADDQVCIVAWWAVCSIWLAELIQKYSVQFQSFPGSCLLLVKTTCRLFSISSGISRGPANWVCVTLSPRTVDQLIVRMSCGGSLTQIGQGVWTAGDPPQDIP
jgi:hypothetical protein